MATRTRNQTDLDHILDELRHRAEVATSSYITLAQAAKSQPPGRNGRPVHLSTILRWIIHGTVSPSGEIVRLQAVRRGGRWLTTSAWIDEYSRRLTPTFENAPPDPTSAATSRAAEQAIRKLAANGI